MRYLAVPFTLAALFAAGVAVSTGEWEGWLFAALFAAVAAFLLFSKPRSLR
jgi:hypothetical protein